MICLAATALVCYDLENGLNVIEVKILITVSLSASFLTAQIRSASRQQTTDRRIHWYNPRLVKCHSFTAGNRAKLISSPSEKSSSGLSEASWWALQRQLETGYPVLVHNLSEKILADDQKGNTIQHLCYQFSWLHRNKKTNNPPHRSERRIKTHNPTNCFQHDFEL